MPSEQEQAANAAESQNELSIADYRAIREGRETPAQEPAKPEKDVVPAGDTPAADKDGSATAKPDDENEEPQSGDSAEKKANRKRGINERFSELTQRTRDLEAQLAAERSARGAGQPESKVSPPATPAGADPKADAEPRAEDFTDYIEWQKSWMRWDRTQASKQEAQQRAQRDAAVEQERKQTAWQEKVTHANSQHGDFSAVALNKDLPVTNVMAQAITDSDTGTEILYHLGQNPDEAGRIAKLSPVAQIRAIGALEARLTAEAATPPEPPDPQPVSQAPKPVRALSGAAAASASPIRNMEGMSQAEYRALRESGRIR